MCQILTSLVSKLRKLHVEWLSCSISNHVYHTDLPVCPFNYMYLNTNFALHSNSFLKIILRLKITEVRGKRWYELGNFKNLDESSIASLDVVLTQTFFSHTEHWSRFVHSSVFVYRYVFYALHLQKGVAYWFTVVGMWMVYKRLSNQRTLICLAIKFVSLKK